MISNSSELYLNIYEEGVVEQIKAQRILDIQREGLVD